MLGLMIGSRAEDFEIFKAQWSGSTKLKMSSDVLLENVRSVLKQIMVRCLVGQRRYVGLTPPPWPNCNHEPTQKPIKRDVLISALKKNSFICDFKKRGYQC